MLIDTCEIKQDIRDFIKESTERAEQKYIAELVKAVSETIIKRIELMEEAEMLQITKYYGEENGGE
jgi:hypothetical protein